MKLNEIVDDLPIGELENTDASPFWYTKSYDGPANAEHRYHHEAGKVGDVFYDGNNGDKWKVLAINTKYCRAIVENKTQHGMQLVYWESAAIK